MYKQHSKMFKLLVPLKVQKFPKSRSNNRFIKEQVHLSTFVYLPYLYVTHQNSNTGVRYIVKKNKVFRQTIRLLCVRNLLVLYIEEHHCLQVVLGTLFTCTVHLQNTCRLMHKGFPFSPVQTQSEKSS